MDAATATARARAAGLLPEWIDGAGVERRVDTATLSQLAGALEAAAAATRARHAAGTMPMRTIGVGERAPWGTPGVAYVLADATGRTVDGRCDAAGQLAAIPAPGYYRLQLGGSEGTVAVAPQRCFGIADLLEGASPRLWGGALQVYSARSDHDAGIGDAAGAADWVARLARAGAASLALSPLHALDDMGSAPSPYSPSDRAFLNPLHAAPALVLGEVAADAALRSAGLAAEAVALSADALIDYPNASAAKWRWLAQLYQELPLGPASMQSAIARFRSQGGEGLAVYADYAAQHAQRHLGGPPLLADPEFQVFAQWLAAESWARVQADARDAGMPIGLIADLAVGFAPGGAEAARHPQAVLRGAHIGAPPDAFNAAGQGWGLAAYAPAALQALDYAPFLDVVRAVMRDRGGIRIDHVLGLLRLWVIPDGEAPTAGAYLRYPFTDLVRLLALESWRHRAIVIGEDLGIVPAGFRDTLAACGILGIDVLPFTHDAAGHYTDAAHWRAEAVATTTTHDLPPLLGWRAAVDVGWQARLGLVDASAATAARAQRAQRVGAMDRAASVAGSAGALHGTVPPGGAAPDATATDDAAMPALFQFVAHSPSPLALYPLEDLLHLQEAPNLPGTVDGHPNWCRRLPQPPPAAALAQSLRAITGVRGEPQP